MNRELAEMVADKPAPKRVDPPLREFSPVVKRLTDIADLLAKHLAVAARQDPNQVPPFERPRPMIQIVLEEKRTIRKVHMRNKLKPPKAAPGANN